MPDNPTPIKPSTTIPPINQPQPASVHWPISDIAIVPQQTSAYSPSGHQATTLEITLTLAPGVQLDHKAALTLLYVVNGSLDFSALFSRVEVAAHSTVTFEPGKSAASITITTRLLPPDSIFELEIIAFPASALAIISGPK